MFSHALAARSRVQVSTEVSLTRRIGAVRTLFLFGRLLVRYFLTGLCMVFQFVRPYALLSTVLTDMKLVAIPSFFLFFVCVGGVFCSFFNDGFVTDHWLFARVVFWTCFFGLLARREKVTRVFSPL